MLNEGVLNEQVLNSLTRVVDEPFSDNRNINILSADRNINILSADREIIIETVTRDIII